MVKFSDKVIVCRDCGKEFVFTAGEQEFYAERGFSEPTRCTSCRAARKTARSGDAYGSSQYGGMGSYSGGGGFSGGTASHGSGRRGSRSGQATRQMYKVTCADCGAETEVPFEPRQGRPVYCRNCYEAHSGRRQTQ